MFPIQSQDSPNALNVILKFGITKAKKREIVRDKGSSNLEQPKAKA